jgi:hypothetical protein
MAIMAVARMRASFGCSISNDESLQSEPREKSAGARRFGARVYRGSGLIGSEMICCL